MSDSCVPPPTLPTVLTRTAGVTQFLGLSSPEIFVSFHDTTRYHFPKGITHCRPRKLKCIPTYDAEDIFELLNSHDRESKLDILLKFTSKATPKEKTKIVLISLRGTDSTRRFILEGQIIGTIWTIAPTIISVFIAIPSLRLLYLIDEIHNPVITLKTVGHQWYWSYGCSDFTNLQFDSYIVRQHIVCWHRFEGAAYSKTHTRNCNYPCMFGTCSLWRDET
jgi:hypothetical protein